ncbi:MAG: YqaE/Pmp3 family membrane protein [Gammaproteobacteria bacterium]
MYKENNNVYFKTYFCFFLPPLAAFLQIGISTHFWINIILTILGVVPGICHAYWLVLTKKSS